MKKTVKKGFTLIELMIVVAIIAIIAAIAIPNLLAAKMSANETAAIGSLNAIKNAQTLFAERDVDGDGAANYFVANAFGLYAIANSGGTAVKLIQDPATANSDTSTAITEALVQAFAAFDYSAIDYDASITVPGTPVPKQGYYTETMPAISPNAGYGFSAYPSTYNRDGVRTFIVNQAGVVYQVDAGEGVAVTTWPGENPNSVTHTDSGGTATKVWQVAK